ncbi:MAG TPA: hypothetical protein VJT69_17040 [Pyrinomonadaceae bacterium]|nr:hypothetical protein [Pyrinomonadaceae bacterium]
MYLRSKTVLFCTLSIAITTVLISRASSERTNTIPADQPQRLETELITITTTGFEPAEITRPQGQFFLDVDNRSELNDLELYLERVNGVREKSAKMLKTAPELRLPLDLPPGTYRLREGGHTKWLSTITITAK